MIERKSDSKAVRKALRRSRVVAILGPRQSGKTTLAREFVSPQSPNYFDLEDPTSLARLEEPGLALRPLKGLVVIDEIQRRPDLFPILRVLADRKPLPARFLILGSASPELLRQSSETLAGRLETLPLEGFRLADLGASRQPKHWLRGGFPLSFTARSEADSFAWRRQLVQTFLERDLPGYAVEEIIKAIQPDQAYYWSTYSGAELDLLMFKKGKRIGVECKRTDAPRFTPSMGIALTDLKLDTLHVVYPGDRQYRLAEKIEATPLARLVSAK